LSHAQALLRKELLGWTALFFVVLVLMAGFQEYGNLNSSNRYGLSRSASVMEKKNAGTQGAMSFTTGEVSVPEVKVEEKEQEKKKKVIKLVAFADRNYVPIAEEWYDHLRRLGYGNCTNSNDDVEEQLAIVATDLDAYRALTAAGTNFSIPTSIGSARANDNGGSSNMPQQRRRVVEYWQVQLQDPAVDPKKKKKGKRLLGNMWRRRLEYALYQVRHNVSVFLSDADTVFGWYVPLRQFEDERQQQQQLSSTPSSGAVDVYHAYGVNFPPDVYRKQRFVVTAGFSYYKANFRTEQLLSQLVKRCHGNANQTIGSTDSAVVGAATASTGCDDQVELNRYYHEHVNWTAAALEDEQELTRLYGRGGRIGVDPSTGLHVYVWPRNFAWRGPFPAGEDQRSRFRCPTGWWAAMPLAPKNGKSELRMSAAWRQRCGGGEGYAPQEEYQ